VLVRPNQFFAALWCPRSTASSVLCSHRLLLRGFFLKERNLGVKAAERELPLLKAVKDAIIAPKPPISGECQIKSILIWECSSYGTTNCHDSQPAIAFNEGADS